jgi:hypothetical protein
MFRPCSVHASHVTEYYPNRHARNGNLEVSVYVLKAKQVYTVRKIEKVNGYSIY